MWTVLFFLNLGALHCSVSSSPPIPTNVTFSSVNLRNELRWLPGSGTPDGTLFKVEYAIYGDSVKGSRGLKVNWRPVPRCAKIVRSWCDLSNETWDEKEGYHARVRAVSQRAVSAWANTRKRFDPWTDTSFGPPLVSVEIKDNNAILTLKGPMRYQPGSRTPAISMATLYPYMTYDLFIVNRGTTLHVPVLSNSYTYRLMEYDTEYCFSAKTRCLSKPARCWSSAPHCITTPQDPMIGQLQTVVVGIVVSSVCICILAAVGYFLYRYLTGQGQKSPYILDPPAFHPPVLIFPPENPNLIVIAIVKEKQAKSGSDGYASQRPETPPEPEEPRDDSSLDYGFVGVAPGTATGGEGGSHPKGEEEQKRAAGNRYKKKEWRVEDGNTRRETEEIPLLSAYACQRTAYTPTSRSDRSGFLPDDYGVLRMAAAHAIDEDDYEEEGNICIDWSPETGKLVLPLMGGLMQRGREEVEEEEEEKLELRLEHVIVRQGSEEKAEEKRAMEGGGAAGGEPEDFLTRWNLVIPMDE
ncbi:interleukin-20 receptor subunit alpha [Clinocottus analis]|uniref:interleukin-20 receptor subunit alpha n=1 Tax=Clinocottus analis TaxID=304258 RepID=UPI0035BF6219